MKRKGSLSLSIEAIVIVVIAFVILGLGLGFVRSQFAQIEQTAGGVQEQIRQQILDDLRTGNKKLSFPATKLTLETSEESVQAIGVKNTEDETKVLKIEFLVKAICGGGAVQRGSFCPFGSEVKLNFVTTTGTETSASISWDDSEISFGPGESRVIPVTISAPDKSGNYLYKVVIVTEEEVFDERTFFIKTS